MVKVVCYFSGWFERDINDVMLLDPTTGTIKTAAEWLVERGNITSLILESFDEEHSNATDGEFEDLTLTIEND